MDTGKFVIEVSGNGPMVLFKNLLPGRHVWIFDDRATAERVAKDAKRIRRDCKYTVKPVSAETGNF